MAATRHSARTDTLFLIVLAVLNSASQLNLENQW